MKTPTGLFERDSKMRLLSGSRFGRWYIDRETNSEVVFVCFQRGDEPSDVLDYYVPMDRCKGPRAALDWIDHIAAKNWCSEQDLADLALTLLTAMVPEDKRFAREGGTVGDVEEIKPRRR